MLLSPMIHLVLSSKTDGRLCLLLSIYPHSLEYLSLVLNLLLHIFTPLPAILSFPLQLIHEFLILHYRTRMIRLRNL